MKIILLKDIPKIGQKNDIKEVADGYALNFILPRGLGVKATEAEIKKMTGIVLDPEFIDLEKPIKEIGNYVVEISAQGKKGKVKVVIENAD